MEKYEIALHKTITCELCDGKKSLHNSEWIAFNSARDAYEAAEQTAYTMTFGAEVWVKVFNEWMQNWWIQRGYSLVFSMLGNKVSAAPPEEWVKCPKCKGRGEFTEKMLVPLEKLRRMLGVTPELLTMGNSLKKRNRRPE